MNLKRLSGIFLIILVVTVSLNAENPVEAQTVYYNTGYDSPFSEDPNFINRSARALIYNHVNNYPGVHLRSICSSLGVSIGTVQYHLDRLVEAGLLEVVYDAKYKRFFKARLFSGFEKKLFSVLNRETSRRIILLLGGGVLSHQELVSLLGVSSQAVTWQVRLLGENGVVTGVKDGNCTRYWLTSEAVQCLDSTVLNGFLCLSEID